MNRYVSIDIGGTAIKYGIIGEDGQILTRNVIDTEAKKGGPAIYDKVEKIVGGYCEQEDICGICISTAGMVDTKKGVITYSAPLIPDYAGTEYKRMLEERFQIPCEVENDVNCAGLAEYYTGAAAGSRVALILTVGTGIGGCAVIDGKVFRGFGGSACEVGYMSLRDSDFQTLGAASSLTKKVAGWKMAKTGKQDLEWKRAEEFWNGRRIFEAAKEGDTLCIRAIDEMTDVLGEGIANICYVLNPEIVVLGGGIMAQEAFLKERIENAVARYLVSGIAQHTRLAFAKHKNDAGMLGAFYHFRQHRLEG